MKRRVWIIIGLWLAICLAVSAFGGIALAEQTVETVEAEAELSGIRIRVSSEDAETQFLNSVLGLPVTPPEELSVPLRGYVSGDSLEGGSPSRVLYDALRGKVEQVAAGELSSTEFVFEDIFSYTAADLDMDGQSLFEVIDGVGHIREAVISKIGERMSGAPGNAFNAVLYDCPYEMFWMDKGEGKDVFSARIRYSGTSSPVDTVSVTMTIRIMVNNSYIGESQYTVNSDKIQSVHQAADNAQEIVNRNSGLGDYDKLTAYKEAICDLTEYNHDAADDDWEEGYGDPWQLVYVFDGDDTTNVVCEGYSKAFMYLCDQSSWRGYVDTICVSGTMDGGPHMWNIVTMNGGKHYMADVTNSDAGSIGSDGGLFLDGYYAKSEDNYSYAYRIGSNNITYTYDPDTINLFDQTGKLVLEATEAENLPLALHCDIWPDTQGIISMQVHDKINFTVTGDDWARYQAQELEIVFTEDWAEGLNPYLLMSRGYETYCWVPNDDEQDEYTYTVYARARITDDEHPDGLWVSSNPVTVKVYAGDVIEAPDYTAQATTAIPQDGELVVSVTNNGADYYGCYIKNDNWRMDSRWVIAETGATTEVRMPVFYCEPGTSYDAYVYAIRRGAKQAENETPIHFSVTTRANANPIILNMKGSYLTDEPIRVYGRYENNGSTPLNEDDAWIRVRVYETANPEHEIWQADGDGFYFWTDDLRIGEAGEYTLEAVIREMTDWSNFDSEHTVDGTTTTVTFTVAETPDTTPLDAPEAEMSPRTVLQGQRVQILFSETANAERYSWQVVNNENHDGLMQGEMDEPGAMTIDTAGLDSGVYLVETETSARGYRSGHGRLYFIVMNPAEETEISGEDYFFSCTAEPADPSTGADFQAETCEPFRLRYFVPEAEEVMLLRRMEHWDENHKDIIGQRDGAGIDQECSFGEGGFCEIYGSYRTSEGTWTDPRMLCIIELTAEINLGTPRADMPTAVQAGDPVQIVYHVDENTEQFGYWMSYEDDGELLAGEVRNREDLNPENIDDDARYLYTFTIPTETLEANRAYHIYLDITARGFEQGHGDRTLYVVGSPVMDGSIQIDAPNNEPVDPDHPEQGKKIIFSDDFRIDVSAEGALDTHIWCEATQDFRDEVGAYTTTWYNIDWNPGHEAGEPAEFVPDVSCDFYAIARYEGSYLKLSPTLTLYYDRENAGNVTAPTLTLENEGDICRGDRIRATVGAIENENVREYVVCLADEDGNVVDSSRNAEAGEVEFDTRYLQEGFYTLYAYARVTGQYRTDSEPIEITIYRPEVVLWYNGTRLEDGEALSGKYYYRLYVTGLPEDMHELQVGFNENMNATKPFRNQWETRGLNEDENGRYFTVTPVYDADYLSEVMFARMDEEDRGTSIRLHYNRNNDTTGHDAPVINTTTAPTLGQPDYVLEWTGTEGAEFYRILWSIRDEKGRVIDAYEYEAQDTSLYMEYMGGEPTWRIGTHQIQVISFGNGYAWTPSTVWEFEMEAPAPMLIVNNDQEEVTLTRNETTGIYTATVPMHQWMDFSVIAPGAEVAYVYCEDEETENPQNMIEGPYFNGNDRVDFKYTPNELPAGFDTATETGYTKYLYIDVCYNNQQTHRQLTAVINAKVDQTLTGTITYTVPNDVNRLEEGIAQVTRDGRFFVDVNNNTDADFYGLYIAKAGVDASDDYRDWIADSHWVPLTEGAEKTRVPLTIPRCEVGEDYEVHVYAIKFGAPMAEAATRPRIHVTEAESGCPVIISMGGSFTTGEPLRVFAHYTNLDHISGWMTIRIHNADDENDVIFDETSGFEDFWDSDAVCRHSGTYKVDAEIWTWSSAEGNHIHAFYDDIYTFEVTAAGQTAAPVIDVPAFLTEGQGLTFTISANEQDIQAGKAAPTGYEYGIVRADRGWQWIAGDELEAGENPVQVSLNGELFEAGGVYMIWATAYKDGCDSANANAGFVVKRNVEGSIILKVNGSTAATQTALSSTDVEVKVEVGPENRPTAVRLLNGSDWEYMWDRHDDFSRTWHYAGGDEIIYAEATYDNTYDFEELNNRGWEKHNGKPFDWNKDVEWTAASNVVKLQVINPNGTIAVPNAELLNEDFDEQTNALEILRDSDLIIRINDSQILDTDGDPINGDCECWYACHIEKWEENEYGWGWNRVWENVQPQLHSGVNYIPTYRLDNGEYRVEIGADAQGYEGVSRYLKFEIVNGEPPTQRVKRFTVNGDSTDAEVPVNQEMDLVAYDSGADWIIIEITKTGDEGWYDSRDCGGNCLGESWSAHEPGEYTLTAYGCGMLRDKNGNEITDENGNRSSWREPIGTITVTATAAEDPLAAPGVTVNGANLETAAAAPADAQNEHTLTIEISTVANGTDYHLGLWEYGYGDCLIDRNLRATTVTNGKLTVTITDERIERGRAYVLRVDAWAIGFQGNRTEKAFLLQDSAEPAVTLSVEEGEYWTAEDIRVHASAQNATAIRIHAGSEVRYYTGDEADDSFTLWNTENLIYAYATTDPIPDGTKIETANLTWDLQSEVIYIRANTYGDSPTPWMYVPAEIRKGEWLEIQIDASSFNVRQMDVRIMDEDGNELEFRRLWEAGTYRLNTCRLEAGETYYVETSCIQRRHTWANGPTFEVHVIEAETEPEAFFRVDKTTVCEGEPFTPWVYAPGAVRVWVANGSWTPQDGNAEDIWGEWADESGTNDADSEWWFDEAGTYVLKAWAQGQDGNAYEIDTVTMTVTGRSMLDRVEITVRQEGTETGAVDVTKDFEAEIFPVMQYSDRYTLQIHKAGTEDEPVFRGEKTAGAGFEDGRITFIIPAKTLEANESYWIDCYVDSSSSRYGMSDTSRSIMTYSSAEGQGTDENLWFQMNSNWGVDNNGAILIPINTMFDVEIGVSDGGNVPTAIAVHIGDRCEYSLFEGDEGNRMILTLTEGQAWPEALYVQAYYEPIPAGTAWENINWGKPTMPVLLSFFGGGMENAEITVNQGEHNNVNAVDATQDFEIQVALVDHGYEYNLELHQTDMIDTPVYRYRLTDRNADENGILTFPISGGLLEANRSYWIDCYVNAAEAGYYGSASSRNIMTTGGSMIDTVSISLADDWLTERGYEIPVFEAFNVTVTLNGTPDPRPTGLAVHMGDICEYRRIPTDENSITLTMCEGQAWPETIYAQVCYEAIGEGDNIDWAGFQWSEPCAPVQVTFIGGKLAKPQIFVNQGENEDISTVDVTADFTIEVPLVDGSGGYRLSLHKPNENWMELSLSPDDAVNGKITWTIESSMGLEANETYWIDCMVNPSNERPFCEGSSTSRSIITTGEGGVDTSLTVTVSETTLPINQDFTVGVNYTGPANETPTAIALTMGDRTEYRVYEENGIDIWMSEYQPYQEALYARATRDDLSGYDEQVIPWEELNWGNASAAVMMTFTSNGGAEPAQIEYPGVLMAGRDLVISVTVGTHANEAHANLDENTNQWGGERLILPNGWIDTGRLPEGTKTATITIPNELLRPGTFMLKVDSSGTGYENTRTQGIIHIVPDPNQSDSKMIMPASLQVIEDEAFSRISAETVIIPNTVTNIGVKAFAYSEVRYVVIPDNVTSIAGDAFEGCNLEVVYGGTKAEEVAEAYGAIYCGME